MNYLELKNFNIKKELKFNFKIKIKNPTFNVGFFCAFKNPFFKWVFKILANYL